MDFFDFDWVGNALGDAIGPIVTGVGGYLLNDNKQSYDQQNTAAQNAFDLQKQQQAFLNQVELEKLRASLGGGAGDGGARAAGIAANAQKQIAADNNLAASYKTMMEAIQSGRGAQAASYLERMKAISSLLGAGR